MNNKRQNLRGKGGNNGPSIRDEKGQGFWGYFLAFLVGGAVTAVFFISQSNFDDEKGQQFNASLLRLPESSVGATVTAAVAKSTEIRSLDQLLARSAEELEKVDIGLMNLLCAEGLPGAEDIDIDACLVRLDEWAEHVKADTAKRLWYFRSHPAKYDHSEGKCRMVNLGLALRLDKGVHYNMENMKRVDFSDSREIFIHGPLMGKDHGSCTNLPVLGAAVARRLGYPVKLAPTKEHYFLRWEDEKTGERFNIELATAGVSLLEDEYYENWPRKQTELDRLNVYILYSMNAVETLAVFMDLRGDVLTDAGRVAEAQVAYAQAYRLLRGHYG